MTVPIDHIEGKGFREYEDVVVEPGKGVVTLRAMRRAPGEGATRVMSIGGLDRFRPRLNSHTAYA